MQAWFDCRLLALLMVQTSDQPGWLERCDIAISSQLMLKYISRTIFRGCGVRAPEWLGAAWASMAIAPCRLSLEPCSCRLSRCCRVLSTLCTLATLHMHMLQTPWHAGDTHNAVMQTDERHTVKLRALAP